MDIRGQVKGAAVSVVAISAIFGGIMAANAAGDDTPTQVVEPVAVVKTAAPEPVVTPTPTPEPVVVVPEVVVPEPVVEQPAPAPEPATEPEPVVEAQEVPPVGAPNPNEPIVLQPGEAAPADAPAGTAYRPPVDNG